jgi:hypothetical protein
MINISMEEKNNVIRFPIERRLDAEFKPASEDLEDMCDQYAGFLLTELHHDGYDISNEDYVYDISLMFESLRSLLFKFNSITHPMQGFSQTLYTDHNYVMFENPDQLEFDFF